MIYPRSVLVLAIEATNPNVPTPGVLLARSEDDKPGAFEVLAQESLASAGRNDDVLLPSISRLFKAIGLSPRDLDEVLVSIGPGGFTATRLACTGAAVIAELTGAQVRVVDTVRVAIETAFQERPDLGPTVVAMASKRETAFAARFDGDDRSNQGPNRAIGIHAFEQLLLPGDCLLFEDHLPDAMLEISSKRRVECIPMRLTADGLLASRDAGQVMPVEVLRPIYPREPDAVTQWRERYGRAPGDA